MKTKSLLIALLIAVSIVAYVPLVAADVDAATNSTVTDSHDANQDYTITIDGDGNVVFFGDSNTIGTDPTTDNDPAEQDEVTYKIVVPFAMAGDGVDTLINIVNPTAAPAEYVMTIRSNDSGGVSIRGVLGSNSAHRKALKGDFTFVDGTYWIQIVSSTKLSVFVTVIYNVNGVVNTTAVAPDTYIE